MREQLLRGLLVGALAAVLAVGSAGAEEPAPKAEALERGWLGALLGDAVDGGVQLVALVPGGPGDRHGLQAGDVLVHAAGRPLARVRDLERVLEGLRPGDRVTLGVLRSGHAVEREIELGRRRAADWFRAWSARVPTSPGPGPSVLPPLFHEGGRGLEPYGLRVTDVTADLRRHYGAPAEAGVLVTNVDPEGAGAMAGFRVGDVLVALAGRPIRSADELRRRLGIRDSGDGRVEISLVRGREPQVLAMGLCPPSDAAESAYRSASRDVSATGPGPASPGGGASSQQALLRRTIESEIRRLEERIRELNRQLERLQRQD